MLNKTDLSQIQKAVRTETKQIVKQELTPLKKDVKTLKSGVLGMKRTMGVMLDVLDREDVTIRKRVERLEEHAGISSQ